MSNFAIPIGGIVKAITYCTVPGQVSTNTHKWQLVSLSSGTSFAVSDFSLDYDTALAGEYKQLLSTGAQYYGSQFYLMNPLGLPPRPDHVDINSGPGTFGAGLLPTQSSGLISLYSQTMGKIGQGRSYIPFPSLLACEANGTPVAGYLSLLALLGGILSTQRVVAGSGGNTGTFRPVLYRGGTDTPRFIENFSRADAWATQRRRGSYGRLNSLPF